MSYLVDTNVISELRKASRSDRNVSRWFAGVNDDDVFISVLTVGELRQGVERIRRRDRRSGALLDRWLHGIVDNFDERILPVDIRIAEEWGRMNVPNPLPVVDGLLVATANVYGLTSGQTIYFGRASGTTGKLYPTSADAVAGTNALDFTTTGSGTHTFSGGSWAQFYANITAGPNPQHSFNDRASASVTMKVTGQVQFLP